jgi:Transglutaminase-like superfamily
VSWGGVPTDVFHVSLLSKGIKQTADITADGTIIKGKLGGFLELKAEPEATAKKLDTKAIDLMSLSSITIDKDLGDPRRVESLTLEVSGLDDFKMPDSLRQKVRTDKDAVVVELRREFPTSKAEPLSDKERAENLEATPSIQCDNEKVRALARKVVRDEKDPMKVTRRLVSWVSSSLRPTYKANASTTLDVLDNMAGDCTEHTLLFVSLARACGVPAREVGGVMFADVGKPFFAWHAWAEVHDGKQWIAVDPTWNEIKVDATHVKFSNGDDMGWLNVLGKVKFKAVKFETKPDTQEALTKQIIETTDDLIEVVGTVKDEQTARDARLRLRRLNERLKDLKQRSEALIKDKKKEEKTDTEKKSGE